MDFYHKIVKVRKIGVLPQSLPIGREMGEHVEHRGGEEVDSRGRARSGSFWKSISSRKEPGNGSQCPPYTAGKESCFTDMIVLNHHDLFMVVVGGTSNIFPMVKRI